MAKKTIYERIKDWIDGGETTQERRLRLFRNASTLEGVIVNKHFTPKQESGGGLFSTYNYSPKKCMLGVELTDGSQEIFHYYGSRAEKVYLFAKKGEKVSFKEGFKPFDTE